VVDLRAIKKLFERPKEIPPEIANEVPVVEVEERPIAPDLEVEPIFVKSVELKDVVEVQEAAEEVRKGNIIVVDIEELLRRPDELRRAVEQLKDISRRLGGDIGKLTDSKIILTPRFIKIQFRRAA
jgi:SepF-like predicted cell division protein (DUF552 family)